MANAKLRRDSRLRPDRPPCSVDGCKKAWVAKGMCHKHWKEQYIANMTPEQKRAFYRSGYNRLPKPTRPEAANCECCGKKFQPNVRSRKEKTKVPQLDHDHVTGQFRGWLCYHCNVGIGLLGDSLEGVLRAARYLKTVDLR